MNPAPSSFQAFHLLCLDDQVPNWKLVPKLLGTQALLIRSTAELRILNPANKSLQVRCGFWERKTKRSWNLPMIQHGEMRNCEVWESITLHIFFPLHFFFFAWVQTRPLTFIYFLLGYKMDHYQAHVGTDASSMVSCKSETSSYGWQQLRSRWVPKSAAAVIDIKQYYI